MLMLQIHPTTCTIDKSSGRQCSIGLLCPNKRPWLSKLCFCQVKTHLTLCSTRVGGKGWAAEWHLQLRSVAFAISGVRCWSASCWHRASLPSAWRWSRKAAGNLPLIQTKGRYVGKRIGSKLWEVCQPDTRSIHWHGKKRLFVAHSEALLLLCSACITQVSHSCWL